LAGALPQTRLGELTALSKTPWLNLNGPASKGREGKGRKREGERGRRGKGKDDLPYDLGDLEMTWLLRGASTATGLKENRHWT